MRVWSTVAAAVMVVVGPWAASLHATARQSSEHGYLLHYDAAGRARATDFYGGELSLTAKDEGDADEAELRAELAFEGHVYKVELNQKLAPATPSVATIEQPQTRPMGEGAPVRAAYTPKARLTVRDPAADSSLVTGEQTVFGFSGSRSAGLPPAKAQLVVRGQARVWRDGRLISGSAPVEVAILEHGLIQPERGGATVAPPSAKSNREVHLVVEGLPVRSVKEGRLHAVFDRADVTLAESAESPRAE